jgi:AcrR family transcriptional regulator
MATTLRKEREVRERELRLIEVARRMLVAQGYAGLSMDRLAEATEYSKGTIYQHFKTKEDLVTALATQSMGMRTQLFERLAKFEGRARERMQGAGTADEIFARLYPYAFRSELIVKMANLEERVSEQRLNALRAAEQRCISVVRGFVEDAIAVGDLPKNTAVGQILFAVISIVIGTHTVVANFKSVVTETETTNPFAALRQNVTALLDGFGWKPLSSEWDYSATDRRLTEEIFADEWSRLRAG